MAGTSDGTGGSATTYTWDGGSLEDATALVTADGQGLNMRAEPSWSGEVITQIPDGTVVALRIAEVDTVHDPDGVTRWWPVAFGGASGWVAGSNLADSGNLPAGTTSFSWDGGSLSDATANVNAEAGLRMRAEPSGDADVLATIPDGSVVDLWIDEVDTVQDPDGATRWWPVVYDGQRGWVSGLFLTSATGSAASTGVVDTAATAKTQFTWDGGELEGATAIVAGDGENVNVRSEPSETSETVTKAADGAVVDLRIDRVDTVLGEDGETRWWPVKIDGEEGWISGWYLTSGTQAGAVSASSATSSSALFPAGSTAMVQTASGGGARLHADPDIASEQVGSVAERSNVTVLSGPAGHDNSDNGWFEVRNGEGVTGYVDGDLLVLIATPEAAPSATETPVTPVPTELPGEDPPALAPTEAPATETPTVTPQQRATEEVAPTNTPAPTATAAPTEQDTARQTPASQPTQAPTQAASSGSQFIVPVSGAIKTQGFGCSSLGFYPYNPEWGCGVHDGIDFAAPAYTPIMAAADGTVVTAGWCDCGLGYYVEIDHGNSVHTLYGHMATQPYVSVGQRVTQGETIGPVGSTGLSTGPHTHFMVQVNGVSQDPARYLP